MTITRNNCAAAFLDYYEQTLSPVEVAEVLFFLEENPDLKEVFESYEAIFLVHEKVKFPSKDSLKKNYSSEEIDAILSSEITKTNYEQFFVACAEGMLSKIQTQKLHAFLAQHPELKKEYELFNKCKLAAEPISFENKHLLKKETVNAQNREEYFVKAIEKGLSAEEQKQLTSFLQKNPSYKNEFEIFKKTILVPEKISFEFKAQLKKRERKPVLVSIFFQRSTYYAAAASVLLLAGLFFFLRGDDNSATYLANNTGGTTTPDKVENVKSAQGNNPAAEIKEAIAPQVKEASEKGELHVTIRKNTHVNNNLNVQATPVKEEIISQPTLTKNEAEEPLLAKKADEKRSGEEQVEKTIIAKTADVKTDSASVAFVQEGVIASTALPKKNIDEYQTVASIVNKKVRSILGIKKSTECETSDKIGLWDLAMVAKKEVQKIIGVRTLDVNKVCEGTEGKVEYVFAAGNFEISKSASR